MNELERLWGQKSAEVIAVSMAPLMDRSATSRKWRIDEEEEEAEEEDRNCINGSSCFLFLFLTSFFSRHLFFFVFFFIIIIISHTRDMCEE